MSSAPSGSSSNSARGLRDAAEQPLPSSGASAGEAAETAYAAPDAPESAASGYALAPPHESSSFVFVPVVLSKWYSAPSVPT